MSIIRITVSGRAATEPAIKEVNGSSCASFGLFGDTPVKDAQGNRESIFFWVSVWGKRGESIARHLKKGERILVMGSYTQQLYKDQGGETKIQNRITAQDVDYLGGGQPQAKEQAGATAAPVPATPMAAPYSDDELPF